MAEAVGHESYTLRFGDRKIKLRDGQLSAKTIGKVFNLFPDSVILLEKNGMVETPNSSGFSSFLQLPSTMFKVIQLHMVIALPFSFRNQL